MSEEVGEVKTGGLIGRPYSRVLEHQTYDCRGK